MSRERLVSHAQNGEDVILWRALGHLERGTFVDVGGWDPDVDSVTRVFYERGWRGIDIEPVPDLAARFRDRRPDDEVVQAAITDQPVDEVVLHRFGSTGLSTLDPTVAQGHGRAGRSHEEIAVPAARLDDVLAQSRLVGDDIHFLKIDVEGAEDQVLASLDLGRWRPWVLVVEATEPNSVLASHHGWEPGVLAAGYQLTLFDGLSRYYVSPDHTELAATLSYPACPLDDFETAETVALRAEAGRLHGLVAAQEAELQHSRNDANRWRNDAVVHWASAAAAVQERDDIDRQAQHDRRAQQARLEQVRKNLRSARDDRTRLRAKVTRLRARVQRLQARVEHAPAPDPRRLPRVRATLAKLARR